MADVPSPNPYIRTYAKDVAELSGKEPPPSTMPAPTVTASAPTISTPPPTPVEAPAPKVEVDPQEVEREAVLARLRERALKDPVHQAPMLPPTLPMPLPIADSTDEQIPVTPAPEPVPVVEPVQVPAAVVIPPPLPPPVIPEPSTLPPPPQPEPLVEERPILPIPEPEPQKPVSLDGVSPIHTYKSDFSDRIDVQGASTFSVLAAQSDAGTLSATRGAAPTKKRGRGILIAAGGLILILLGGAGAYAAYRYVSTRSVVAITALNVPSLIFADERTALTGEGTQLVQAMAASAETPLPDGQVRVLYLTESSTTPDRKTTTIPLAGGRLVGSLQLSAPDILLRNVAPESTVGIVHAGSETRAFFILKVLSYERTFAGMLQWEGTMESALAILYPEYPAAPLPAPTIATTTTLIKGKRVVATTTVQAAPVATIAPRFIDEVASNNNVRALKDGAGRTILLYGYKDKDTLVIARDEQAFAEIVNRLSATKQQ